MCELESHVGTRRQTQLARQACMLSNMSMTICILCRSTCKIRVGLLASHPSSSLPCHYSLFQSISLPRMRETEMQRTEGEGGKNE